jgi:hypothetical protein
MLLPLFGLLAGHVDGAFTELALPRPSAVIVQLAFRPPIFTDFAFSRNSCSARERAILPTKLAKWLPMHVDAEWGPGSANKAAARCCGHAVHLSCIPSIDTSRNAHIR